MTPIKLNDFLKQTVSKTHVASIDLLELGLYHSAPHENGQPVLTMRFDSTTGTLVPST